MPVASSPSSQRRINGHPLVYLDSAASAQKPKAVIDAIANRMATSYANVHRGLHTLANETTEAYEARALHRGALSQRRIGVGDRLHQGRHRGDQPGGQYLGRSSGEGDAIVLTEMEHHSNLVPWHMLRESRGVVLKFAPVFDDGSLDLEGLRALLGPKTLVALTHMSNVLGTINPIKAVVESAHAAGALVLVDGCQGAVHAAPDVQDLDCDFYVFTGHRPYGPHRHRVLYGKAERLAALPLAGRRRDDRTGDLRPRHLCRASHAL